MVTVVKHSSKVCLLMPYIYCLIPYITKYNTERELLSTLPEIVTVSVLLIGAKYY